MLVYAGRLYIRFGLAPLVKGGYFDLSRDDVRIGITQIQLEARLDVLADSHLVFFFSGYRQVDSRCASPLHAG